MNSVGVASVAQAIGALGVHPVTVEVVHELGGHAEMFRAAFLGVSVQNGSR